MKLKRKHRKTIINIITWVIVIVSVVAMYFGLQVALATPTPWVAIASGSMRPALEVGDLVIVQGVPSSDIKIGDIIVFTSPQGSRTIHRVIKIETLTNGTILFKTKGDANAFEDAYWTAGPNVYGRLLYRIPFIGWLALEPTIPLMIMMIIIIIIVLYPEKHRFTRKH